MDSSADDETLVFLGRPREAVSILGSSIEQGKTTLGALTSSSAVSSLLISCSSVYLLVSTSKYFLTLRLRVLRSGVVRPLPHT